MTLSTIQTAAASRRGECNSTTDADNNPRRLSFKQTKDFLTRKEESAAIRAKFPGKIPVIVERYKKEKYLPAIDRVKFLVPQNLTMSQLAGLIRNRLFLSSSQAFFMFVDGRVMASLSASVEELYNKHRHEDGFMYITYASQEVFG